MDKRDFDDIRLQLIELIKDEPMMIPNLANASAFIMDNFEGLNWAGFYLLHEETLVLGPFQGRPACIRIKMGQGVCGKAAHLDQTLNVPNVHEFEGHIACDSGSNSEIVIPLHAKDKIVGVLDIDSPRLSRFSLKDQEELQALAMIIEQYVFNRE